MMTFHQHTTSFVLPWVALWAVLRSMTHRVNRVYRESVLSRCVRLTAERSRSGRHRFGDHRSGDHRSGDHRSERHPSERYGPGRRQRPFRNGWSGWEWTGENMVARAWTSRVFMAAGVLEWPDVGVPRIGLITGLIARLFAGTINSLITAMMRELRHVGRTVRACARRLPREVGLRGAWLGRR